MKKSNINGKITGKELKIMLKNKSVLLGVTSSIAAYKSATLAHILAKQGCDVNVIMTKNATEIIAPLTF